MFREKNVVPAHQKNDKKFLKNYEDVAFLPICGKIFQKLTYN